MGGQTNDNKCSDKIVGNHGRVGEIINIGIATEMTDIAENDTALNAKTYDTDLAIKR